MTQMVKMLFGDVLRSWPHETFGWRSRSCWAKQLYGFGWGVVETLGFEGAKFSCFELAIDLKGILISHFLSAFSIEFAIVMTAVPI